MTPTPGVVVEALRDVPEPCSIAMRRVPLDIVEMGLVDDVRIAGGTVHVELVLTDPSCVHFTSMRRFIRDVVMRLEGVETVEVVMSTKKLWTADRMDVRKATA
jgi:metal-sulfur cluster biosynthetic enzyme